MRWEILLIALALLGACSREAENHSTPSADESRDWQTIQGFSWGWEGRRGDYNTIEAAESMKQLAHTGAEWVCIAFATRMKTAHSTDFTWGNQQPSMVTDAEICRAIHLARDNRLKVILKPVINCADGTWRAWICFYRPVTSEELAAGVTGELDPWGVEPVRRDGEVTDLKRWSKWWRNYSAFLLHYAKLAQENDVEMFCLGCEMASTEKFVDEWRELIGQVRKVYTGLLTYNVNHDAESAVTWWDAVDVISISAYYAVPPVADQTVEKAAEQTTPLAEIVSELGKVKLRLAALSRQWQKPILMLETGVTNVRGCARYPWSHPGSQSASPLDETEQANYYRASLEVFADEPWCLGFTWWEWPATLYEKSFAAEDLSFCIFGKQAEAVVREWYAKPTRPVTVAPSSNSEK